MTQHATTDATVRNAALRLLANGDATMAEVAALVGISRQRVLQWVWAANIDPLERRQTKLANLWAIAQASPELIARVKSLTGTPKRKRP